MKHRQNTNQKQRIIAFLGSPLNLETSNKESLKELGLKMKKNGIAIDLIDFGTENRSNTAILEGLIEGIDSEAQISRLITIEAEQKSVSSGTFLLDSLKNKVPELFNRSANNELNGGDGFDFDPEMDPELAMALKLSMEEEVNRQLKEEVNNNTEKKSVEQNAENLNNNDGSDVDHDIKIDQENENEENDEELMLSRAIALSMEQEQEKSQEKN